MADDDRRVKRSRFDQTDPEPRRSRFDRRSRSPSARQSESTRTRSPLSREPRSPAGDGTAKASLDPAAAAGRLNAVLYVWKEFRIANTYCSGLDSCRCSEDQCSVAGKEGHPTC